MPKQYTIGKNERLKSRKAIDALFKKGKRFTVKPFRVHYSINTSTDLHFGTGASIKHFKKAIVRNRIKRLTREAYRLQNNILQSTLRKKGKGMDLFLIYAEKEIPDYSLVFSQVEVILNKLYSIIDEIDT